LRAHQLGIVCEGIAVRDRVSLPPCTQPQHPGGTRVQSVSAMQLRASITAHSAVKQPLASVAKPSLHDRAHAVGAHASVHMP